MIQLNLLPDVKLEFLKTQRTQRLIISIAVIVSIAAIALVVLLFSYSQVQKKHISDLSTDITTKIAKLHGQNQIDKILTVQNQLNSLTDLHAQKPAASRLFTYLNQVTPVGVNISSFTIDFNAHTSTITGNSDTLSSVNKYVDTLKFTTYKVQGDNTSHKAFSAVVLSSFALSSDSTNPSAAATYTITLAYDPPIFDITKTVTLTVPSQTTTRSEVDQPTDLFQAAPAKKGTN